MALTVQNQDIASSGAPVTAPTAPDRVYADLRQRILRLDLPPDATLGRAELAAAYSVSQTPVREALQRLEQDGLVLIYPQSKTTVSRIDVRQLWETHFLRVAVETEVVRRLAETPGADAVQRARAILRMQRALIEGGEEMDMFSDLDRSFHRTLFEGVGMGSLHAMVTRRMGHLYRCQRLELPRQGKMQDIVDAHQSILDALAAGDADAAAQAMRRHLSGTITRIDTLRADHPDFFTGDAMSRG